MKRDLPNADGDSNRSDMSDKIGIKLGTSLDANYRLEESMDKEAKAE